MANKDDLRYVRTETAIRAAFMDLVSKGPGSPVTVSAICRKAKISRNAFYLHHAGVNELYAALVGELVDDVRAESVASSRRRVSTGEDEAFEEAIITSLARHEELLRALLPADDGSITKRLMEDIEEAFVEAALHFGKHGGSPEQRLRCAYAAGAVVGFLIRWMRETKRPLTDSLERFRELHASAVETSVNYLMEGAADQTAARPSRPRP